MDSLKTFIKGKFYRMEDCACIFNNMFYVWYTYYVNIYTQTRKKNGKGSHEYERKHGGKYGKLSREEKQGEWCNYILKRLIHQPRKAPAFALVYKSVYRFLFTCDRVVNSFVFS